MTRIFSLPRYFYDNGWEAFMISQEKAEKHRWTPKYVQISIHLPLSLLTLITLGFGVMTNGNKKRKDARGGKEKL